MTNEKCFIYDEYITVYKNNNGRFIVNFYDDFEVRITQSEILDVIEDEIPEIVAVLIASVKEKYQETKTERGKISKLTDSQISETLRKLLDDGYIAEDLIQLFMQVKWHEIVEIFSSNKPRTKLEQIKELY